MSKDLRSDIAEPVIEACQLRRRYGGQRSLLARSGPGTQDRGSSAQQGFEAVRGVDLQVGRGELFALLGTNGAGKTSTVELIEGLAKPSGGSVRILGRDPWVDRAVVRPQIGIMLQEAGFPGALTVREMARAWHGTLDHPRTVDEALAMVVLQHRADVPIESLSGGERRRLDLALALMGRPAVIFLDEPTTGLDPQSRRATWGLIRHLLDEQTTVLLTTHYLEEAEVLADRIAIMHDGAIARVGTLSDIVAQQPTRISFSVGHDAPVDALRRIAGAGFHLDDRTDRHGVQLETFDPQRLLRLLLDWATDRLVLADLRVLPGSLEQAFLDVARQPVRGGGPALVETEVAA